MLLALSKSGCVPVASPATHLFVTPSDSAHAEGLFWAVQQAEDAPGALLRENQAIFLYFA